MNIESQVMHISVCGLWRFRWDIGNKKVASLIRYEATWILYLNNYSGCLSWHMVFHRFGHCKFLLLFRISLPCMASTPYYHPMANIQSKAQFVNKLMGFPRKPADRYIPRRLPSSIKMHCICRRAHRWFDHQGERRHWVMPLRNKISGRQINPS